jgi:hypothetical protein
LEDEVILRFVVPAFWRFFRPFGACSLSYFLTHVLRRGLHSIVNARLLVAQFVSVLVEEAGYNPETPGIDSGSVRGRGVLRLRLAIRFAHRQTSLRMTGMRTGIESGG